MDRIKIPWHERNNWAKYWNHNSQIKFEIKLMIQAMPKKTANLEHHKNRSLNVDLFANPVSSVIWYNFFDVLAKSIIFMNNIIQQGIVPQTTIETNWLKPHTISPYNGLIEFLLLIL
jgi:hypothetical protein